MYAPLFWFDMKGLCGARSGGRRERHAKTGAVAIKRNWKKRRRAELKKDLLRQLDETTKVV